MSVAFISLTGSVICLVVTGSASLAGTLLQLRPFSVALTPEFGRKRIALSWPPLSAFIFLIIYSRVNCSLDKKRKEKH